eukprot:TRINITY_DN11363_c0_g3_i1.p1 TRINITY_DN11363_c0_g3~~TRINITY_DN11363_c0_g3_i1.p1  ORF type:complete len:921 (+),score=158.34 TRINITY_DN11363_c0_g3_i1:82-2844(+)
MASLSSREAEEQLLQPPSPPPQDSKASTITSVSARKSPGDAPVREENGCCGFFGSSVRCSAKVFAFFVFVASIGSSYLGVRLAPKVMAKTEFVGYPPPEGTSSQIGLERLEELFPVVAKATESQVLMVIRALPALPTIVNPEVDAFSQNVSAMVATDERTSPLKPLVTGFFVGNPDLALPAQDPILRHGFVSEDGRMTILMFVATAIPKPELHLTPAKVRDNVVSCLKQFVDYPPAGTEVLLTGNPVISHDMVYDKSAEALFRAELCVIPLALMVLAYLIGNLRLLVIPPIVLAVSFLTAMAAVYPVTWKYPSFDQDIPSAMVSVTIALSLDYSLFLLTRVNENCALGMSIQENVDVMMQHTAHTIGISGLLIAIAFFGAMTIPEENLQAAGLSLGVTTLCCLVVNATLTPALVLLAGRLLTSHVSPPPRPVRDVEHAIENSTERSDASSGRSLVMRSTIQDNEDAISTTAGSDFSVEQQHDKDNFWAWMINLVQMRPQAAVFVVLMAFMPLMLSVQWLHTSADSYAMLPHTLPSVQGLRAITDSGFSAGRFDPYTVVVSNKVPVDATNWPSIRMPNEKSSAFLTEEAFEDLLELADAFQELGHVASMIGPVYLMDQRVDFQYGHVLRRAVMQPKLRQLRHMYEAMLQTHVKENSAVLQVHTDFAARGEGSSEWVLAAREILKEWERFHPKYRATLSGGAGTAVDIWAVVMSSMSTYLAATVLGVMLVVYFMFGSLLLPLRLAFALVFTLAVTYGAAVVAYQTPLLHSICPWLKDYYGLTYEAVPIATCIAIALGLDYDIFLISRIVEYRSAGMSDRDSIIKGVVQTGGIISGAGVIMALAFSGLLVSPKLQLQQFALLLVTSVLLDTFVVRTVLVPALMLSAGEWNWWPRQMPTAERYSKVDKGLRQGDLEEHELYAVA